MALFDSRTSLANIKNRTEQSHLRATLERIDREQRHEMRMMDNKKRRFQKRGSKKEANFESGYLSHEKSPHEKSGGTIADSNNPSSTEFQAIHALLFTNGEVDIDKVLCLYLLSAHPIASLRPPQKKLKKFGFKSNSPIERLLGRTKIQFKNRRITKMLPLYTLEIVGAGSYPIRDNRLLAKILINHKIFDLVNTVLVALEQSNKEKLQQIIDKAENSLSIKEILIKKETETFLTMLQNHPLVHSCESFSLTPHFKNEITHLRVKTRNGLVDNLLKNLRQNVLQTPLQPWEKIEEEIKVSLPQELKPATTVSSISGPMPQRSLSRSLSKDSTTNSKLNQYRRSLMAVRQYSLEEQKLFGRHIKQNFIAKNIEACAHYKKIEYDIEEGDVKVRKTSSARLERSRIHVARSSLQKNTLPELSEEDTDEADDDEEEESEGVKASLPLKKLSTTRKKSSKDSDELKYHLKQTTCPACMEKWRKPLPTPKTPKVKVPLSQLGIAEKYGLTTNSQNRVSMLINKEMYKLDSYDRRFSNESKGSGGGSRRSSVDSRNEGSSNIMESTNLHSIDLARIEQEIKQRETQKKLENFLRHSI